MLDRVTRREPTRATLLQVGYVEIGSSDCEVDGEGWFFWPRNITSLEALMNDCLFGPFRSQKSAERACDGAWFEAPSRGEQG